MTTRMSQESVPPEERCRERFVKVYEDLAIEKNDVTAVVASLARRICCCTQLQQQTNWSVPLEGKGSCIYFNWNTDVQARVLVGAAVLSEKEKP